ncbi:alkylglycerol monooxygenase-like [Tachypleus tridentatus]|uniref:alkylglycerol monooxygenase-like n=1 Tax=Tachypleus tridentatus TaxID=6853 RepID=UPI003FD3452D
MHIWNTFHKMKGFSNKFSMLFKGPGWSLGSPRLGNLEDIPEPDPNDPKFDPPLPLWCKLYIVCHFAILILELGNLIDRHMVRGRS